MLRTSFIIGAVMGVVALTCAEAALADPVTDADLRGKKICWNTGFTSSYGKDGSFDGNRVGHGTWSLAGDQITIIASSGGGANTITKDNGTFHVFHKNRRGDSIESWGKYCN
jgi:hypothetical protein